VHQEYDNRVPGWGWAANPLLDGDKIICIVGGKNSVVVAFNKDTGKEIWKALSAAEPGYCPPMIYKVGDTRQLIIWHPESINSLDPETGKVFWTHKGLVGAGLTVPTPRLDGNRLFITSFYGGSIMLELNGTEAPKVVWQGKWWGTKERGKEQPKTSDGLHAIMPTPLIHDGYIYGICSYGELRCLKANTGERVWMTLKATGSQEQPTERWGNAFLVAQGDRYFLFNEKGDLIIAKLTPKGYEEISRAHILDPDNKLAGRPVVWSHPAFADKCMFARNDHEIVCVPLGK
jgi:outer membrane protein assembly factor BamB